MDAKFIVCTSCKTRLKVAATVVPGKKVKCPKCSQLITVPAPAAADPGYEVVREGHVPAPQPPTTLAPAVKACPYCGEQVMASAVKCRHCGEFFDGEQPSAAARARTATSSKNELNPAEYIVALLFAPIGLFIGLAWKLKRISKANEMLKLSALSSVILLVAVLLVYFYAFKKDGTLPVAQTGPGYAGGYRPPDYYPEEQPDTSSTLPPVISTPDIKVLESQSAEIQRAMRATVCILSGPGLGTGVVVQRQGDKVLVLTNRHVVDPFFAVSHGLVQSTSKPTPKVKFVTNEDRDGKIVWEAPDQIDLAFLEVSCPDGVEVVPWNMTTEIQIGDRVFAVGNPMGLGWTTTFGQVSAFRDHDFGNRKVPVVQTDTRIGPGNSGGGLYNQKGELIGINTFVVSSSRSSAGETGLGFAIRKNVLMELKPDVMQLPAAQGNP